MIIAQGGLVPVEVVLECFQKILILLGNASNYMFKSQRHSNLEDVTEE